MPGAAAAAASVSSLPLSASLSSAPSVYAVTAAAAAAAASLPANSPAARELRQLQNRLEKATVKANEAYSIRKTYEQVGAGVEGPAKAPFGPGPGSRL